MFIYKKQTFNIFSFFTSKSQSLSPFQFIANDIKSIISKLDSDKVHGGHMISIGMIKLCGFSIYKALETTFKYCLNKGSFWSQWKKS